MNFTDEDGVDDLFNNISYVDSFGLDDPQSPMGHDSLQLQVPMREPSPVSPSRDLDTNLFGFGDSSLSIPMREYGVGDVSQLSPLSSYQTSSQGYGNSRMQMDVPYNSFEQPVAVVKEYNHIGEPAPVQNMSHHSYYANEQPSTSSQQQSGGPSMMQQMLSTPPVSGRTTSSVVAQQNRSAPSFQQHHSMPHAKQQHQTSHASSQPRQRAIQPKTQNGRRKAAGGGSSNSLGEVLTNANKINAGNGGQSSSSVRLSPQQMQQLAFIANELGQLEQQQAQLGIDNSNRIEELKQQQAQIFIEALSAQPQQNEVINQLHQIKQQPVQQQTPSRSTSHSRSSSHRSQSMQQPQHHGGYDAAPDSPQYQPQMYMAPAPQPSTSQAPIYHDYQPAPIVVSQHMQQQHQVVTPQQQRPMYRVATVSQTSVQQQHVQVTSSFQSPQHIYVQQQQQQSGVQQTVSPLTHMQSPAGPTVGQVIRQQQLRSGGVGNKPANGPHRPLMHQQQTATSSQMQVVHPSMQAKIAVFHRPTRPSAPQTAKRIEDKRAIRLAKLKEVLARQQQCIENPDTSRPFESPRDVLLRLLPYHQLAEPDLKQEELEQFDVNYLRKMINLKNGAAKLQNGFRKVLFEESLKSREEEEKNLLLFLDSEYERKKLEEERTHCTSDQIAYFVESSDIISAVRSGQIPSEPRIKPPPITPSKVPLHYEYYPFTDVPRCVSPYKSPVSVKSPESMRSPSPLKSPMGSSSSRIRRRSSASQSSNISANKEKCPRQTPRSRLSPEKKPVVERFRRNSSRFEEDEMDVKVDVKPYVAVDPPVAEVEPPQKVRSRLPAKKELLSRARKAMPLALRSPPAQATRPLPMAPPLPMVPPPPAQASTPVESEGSCSPELGLDDDVIPTAAPATVSTAPAIVSSVPVDVKPSLPLPAPSTSAAPPPTIREVKKNGPSPLKPPPLPFPRRNLGGGSSKDAVVKQEPNPPQERFRFKPQVPRPSKITLVDENHCSEPVKKEAVVKIAATKEEVKVAPAPVLPPIKLKLKLKGLTAPPESVKEKDRNENHCDRDDGTKKKKKKKRKKERDREKGEKKNSSSNTHSHEDMVLVPTEGPRIKIRFNMSRTSTPTAPSADQKSGASSSTARSLTPDVATEEEPRKKVPRLKIRFGVQPPAPPPPVAPVSQQNGPSRLSAATLPAAKAELPSVDFSDDSDSDAERLRSSTDEALRTCGLAGLSLKAVQNTPVLPWSSASSK